MVLVEVRRRYRIEKEAAPARILYSRRQPEKTTVTTTIVGTAPRIQNWKEEIPVSILYPRREFGYPKDRTESFKRCKNGPGSIIAPFEGRSLPEDFTGKELSVGTAPMKDLNLVRGGEPATAPTGIPFVDPPPSFSTAGKTKKRLSMPSPGFAILIP